jgi:tRNA G10  N-methylase Trm11
MEDLIFRCRAGLKDLMMHELEYKNIVNRRAKSKLLKQTNYDFLHILKNKLKNPNMGAIKELRTPEDAFISLAAGYANVTDYQIKKVINYLKTKNQPVKIVSVINGNSFNKFDARRWLEKILAKNKVPISDSAKHLLYFFAVDEKFYIAYKIMSRELVSNREKIEREGALPQTIAAAMAFLANINEKEVVLDPTCGSATLLIEAKAFQKKSELIGIDKDKKACQIAKKNLKNAEILNIDLAKENLKLTKPINVMLANLPFGKQFGEVKTNELLYDKILKIADKNAADNFRGIFITADETNLQKAIKNNKFKIDKKLKVKVKGIWANLIKIKS